MKYETKNNLGLTLLIVGTVALIGVIIFASMQNILSWLILIASVAAVIYGFYLMTRGFTKIDADHPDYNRHNQDTPS